MKTSADRMVGRWSLAAAALVVLAVHAVALADEQPPRPVPPDHTERMKQGLVLFKEQVRPILVAHCVECHGGQATKGDFDLSDRDALVASGMIGDNAASSHLVAVITHAEEPHMPKGADKLPDEKIALIARWIDLGAPYDKPLVEKAAPQAAGTIRPADREFWSFQPLRAVPPPEVDSPWPRTPIDQFILAGQQERGLAPNAIADRRTLVRRAYFDLTGLPPTPEDVEAVASDPDPEAYEKLVDRLLDSPHYGERWARHWLDVARFAESHGYEQDYDRPHAYPYRDFVIQALNADMPYDQFVRWQIAGDELAPDKPLAMAATGFLGAGPFPTQLTEAEFESARYDELDDMTSTTALAVLGLSVGCARCHDHKFDPIPAPDYYRMAATFTTTIRSEIDLVLSAGASPTKVQVTSEGFPHMKHHADERGYPHFYPETHFLLRGDVDQKQQVAPPGFLQVLVRNGRDVEHWRVEPPEGWTRTSFHRAALAGWLTDPVDGAGNLAARVIVNRVWQHHFGRGIVATPNDFGMQGERPSHPELLDWLAADLVEHGWRLKRLHRLIMTSAVYMQTCGRDERRAAIDRENIYLWRRVPRRLEAEAIRDAMLYVSGLLDSTMYGPGTLDPNMRRRSIYFFIKRSQLIPTMMLFDWPEHLVSIGQRATTTVTPQALLLMNSPQARQCAEGLAARLGDGASEERVAAAYRLALGREASEEERALAGEFVARQTAAYHSAGKTDARRLALVDFCQALLGSSEFVYVD